MEKSIGQFNNEGSGRTCKRPLKNENAIKYEKIKFAICDVAFIFKTNYEGL